MSASAPREGMWKRTPSWERRRVGNLPDAAHLGPSFALVVERLLHKGHIVLDFLSPAAEQRVDLFVVHLHGTDASKRSLFRSG